MDALMGRIRLAYPHRRSQMTARLGSFLHQVESGAEKVMRRALRRLRSKAPSPPREGDAAPLDQAARPERAASSPVVAEPAPTVSVPSKNPKSEPSTPVIPSQQISARAPEVSRPAPPAMPQSGLPEVYGRSRVAVLAIDPYHVHAYWEITPVDAAAARQRLDRSGAGEPVWVLRFHDVSGVGVDTSSAHGHFDVDIDLAARNWYIDLWSADKTYLVELGARLASDFSVVCRANPVQLPPANLSPPWEPIWRTAVPERATTEALPPSDPRLPASTRGQSWRRGSAEGPAPETARSPSPEGAGRVAGEQPWVAALRELSAGGLAAEADEAAGYFTAEQYAASEATAQVLEPPTSQVPPTRAATPHALAHGPASARTPAAPGQHSRSVSLTGLRSGSGGSANRGGDPRE